MAKTKKPKEDYAAELQKSFDRWEHIRVNGCNDPCWPDGVNMNLVHNHIFYYKRKIEETMPPEEYPAVYFRETPPEVDRDYIARGDEIRANAKNSLKVYKADPDYKFLLGRVERLTEKQRKETYIHAVFGYVSGLENAINMGDLITMRRHERASSYTDSFSNCAARVRELKPPENEQMSLFDYNNDYEDYDTEDEDEWDCEM